MNSVAHRLLCRARGGVYGAPDQALADIEAFLAQHPTEAEAAQARLVRARIQARTARPGAQAEAEALLAWFQAAGDDAGVAEALVALANVHVLAGCYVEAFGPLARARTLATDRGDQATLAAVLNLLGIARSDLGEVAEAERHLREAIRLSLGPCATGLRMIAQSNLAQNHVRWCSSGAAPSDTTARLIEAEAMLSDAEAFYRASGDALSLSACLDNRAQLWLLVGDAPRALAACVESASLAEARGDPTSLIYCALTRARAHRALEEWRAVLEVTEAALALAAASDLAGGVPALTELRAEARLRAVD